KRSEALPSSTATVRTKKSVRMRRSISRGTSEIRTRPIAIAARPGAQDLGGGAARRPENERPGAWARIQSRRGTNRPRLLPPPPLPVPLRHPGLALALQEVPVHLRRLHLRFDVARPLGQALGRQVGPRRKAVGVLGGEELRLGAPEPFDEGTRLRGVFRPADD